MGVLSSCVSVHHTHVHGSQKMALDALELELYMVGVTYGSCELNLRLLEEQPVCLSVEPSFNSQLILNNVRT